MTYADIERRLAGKRVVILDGGTGTELERRGVPMNADAWSGAAALGHLDVLEAVHRDYIGAGAEIVTVNSFATSPAMLRAAGLGDRFEEINRASVGAALRAREASGNPSALVAGSVSHMVPPTPPNKAELRDGLGALASLLKAEGCDLILLEMMYHPDRMEAAFEAVAAAGLPVWVGFSARRGDDGGIVSYTSGVDIPFAETVGVLSDYNVAAAGVMHTAADATGEALAILQDAYDGPLMAYPDSGYFEMPNWRFENVLSPDELRRFAEGWISQGARVIGGCCGLSPAHIAALAPLRDRRVP